MKKLGFLIFTALVLTSQIELASAKVPAPSKNDPQTIIPGLKVEKQKEEMWCWAAVSRILLSSKIQNLPSQCEIVSTIQDRDCCHASSIACLQPYNLEKALTKLGYENSRGLPKVNPSAHWSKRVDYLGWYNSVVTSIKNGTPVAVSRYNNTGTMDGSSPRCDCLWNI